MPDCKSKSASKILPVFCRAISAATWHAIVVAPHPPLAERKATILPPRKVLLPAFSLLSDKRSSAACKGSVTGGYRYSLTPARRAVKIASGWAEVCSAKTTGCELVERSRFTTSSKGSLSLVTSSRITSGCTRSMRSINGHQSCGISEASKARRIGCGARACFSSSHNSLLSTISPAVIGYIQNLSNVHSEGSRQAREPDPARERYSEFAVAPVPVAAPTPPEQIATVAPAPTAA